MIFKPKIKKVLHYLSISAIAFVCTLTINTLQVRADAGTEAVARSIVDSLGVGNAGGTDKVTYGVSYSRTGYLCYLLDKNGNAVPGTNAIALKSPGFEFYGEPVIWGVISRKGNYTTTQFNGTADWNCSPWNPPPEGSDVCSTNEPQIKDWFETIGSDNVQNAAKFVQDNWNNTDITLKFGQGEYFLVVETLMHFKYSVRSGSDDGLQAKIQEGYAKIDEMSDYELMYRFVIAGYPTIFNTWRSLGGAAQAARANIYRGDLKNSVKEQIEASYSGNGGWEPIGDFVVGTVPNLIDYKVNGLHSNTNVFNSYLNKVAPFAEYIKPNDVGAQLGFTPWTGSTGSQITDSQVQEYGVAMMVISATNPLQTTAEESKIPTPHPAPKESTGTFSIIKSYRTKEGETLTDDGTYSLSNIGNQITIETERDYQVIGWRITNQTSTSVSSLSWNPPGTVQAEGTTPTSVTITDPYKTLYVLLEKTENPPPEVEDYNYKLTQSTITRRINFSNPDNRLTNMDSQSEQIESQTFQWIVPAHKTSCPGNHVFTDACEGHDHNSECAVKCPDTCTKDHTHVLESCTSDHDCGTRCTTQTASCSYGEWHENQLKLSINNIQQSDYPDILVTKTGWNAEVARGHITKHFYLNDAPFTRTSTSAQSYSESNWDYVAVLLRGKDKLTVAQWENAGQGSGNRTNANTDLANLSHADCFTVSDRDSGTRKTLDYMEMFSAKFNREDGDGADNTTTYKPNGDATVPAPDTAKGSVRCAPETVWAWLTNPLSVNNIKVKVETYSGLAAEGVNDTSFNGSAVMTLTRDGFDVSSGRMVQTGSTISFRPYIKMRYDTLTALNQPAYVLSEHQRQITPNVKTIDRFD